MVELYGLRLIGSFGFNAPRREAIGRSSYYTARRYGALFARATERGSPSGRRDETRGVVENINSRAMRRSDGKAPISPCAAFEKSGPCLAQRRQMFPTGYRIFDEANELPIEDRHPQKKRDRKQGWGTFHDRLHRREVRSYYFQTR